MRKWILFASLWMFLMCCASGATQTIDAKLASQSESWSVSMISGIKCMQCGMPGARLVFDVIVPAPGGRYKLDVSLVQAFDGSYLHVLFDGELLVEFDNFAATNGPATIPVFDRFVAAGKHTVTLKNMGQEKASGGNYQYIRTLEITSRDGSPAWQLDEGGFTFEPAQEGSAGGLTALPPRLQAGPFDVPQDNETADVFAHALVNVNGVVFRVPKVVDIPETGFLLKDQEPLEIDLPPDARELFLLLWSKIPAADRWSGPPQTPIGPITQSERFTAEIVYADGTSDHLIPFNLTTRRYGLENGLAPYVLHPVPGKQPQQLVLHDKVNQCSFAVVALSCNTEALIAAEPSVKESCAWHPAVGKIEEPVTTDRIDEAKVDEQHAVVSSEKISAEITLADGLRWNRLGSPRYGSVGLDRSPVFAVRHGNGWIGSDQWRVVDTTVAGDAVSIDLAYQAGGIHLESTVTLDPAPGGKMGVGLTLVNAGNKPFLGRVRFPILEGLKLGSLPDTWYFFPRDGGAMIHYDEANLYGTHGAEHPLQVDSFFNPEAGYALTLLSNDLDGQFRWYDVGKDEGGGWYRQEFLEKRLAAGEAWTLPTCIVAISPGDWRESFRLYRQWVRTWYKPKPPAQDWYKNSFVHSWHVPDSNPDDKADFMASAEPGRKAFDYANSLTFYAWHVREGQDEPNAGYSGQYGRNATWWVGGEDHFRASIKKARDAGIAISLYTNALIINDKAEPYGAKRPEFDGLGTVTDNANTLGYRPCMGMEEWIDYMVTCQKYLTADLGARIVYLDEMGHGGRVCYRKDHPHKSPEPYYYGERELTRRIQAAVAEEVTICSENLPEDIRLQYQNAFYNAGIGRGVRPHTTVPMNMARFAFPDIKCFNLIYHYEMKDQNWDLLKFVLFNGDSYGLSRSYDPESYFSEEAIQEHKRMFRILHENADVFTSFDVEPFIPAKIPGVFVNRFRSGEKTIWTVFNAGYRTARGKLLEIEPKPGATYVDLWKGAPVSADGGSLVVEIGPRDVACIKIITD